MLKVEIFGEEQFDDEKSEFVVEVVSTLELEHSLVSLSKWESIWEIPFLGAKKKTAEETESYIKCMSLTDVDVDDLLDRLSNDNVEQINAYIGAKMSATWFTDLPGAKKNTEVITSELLYYWMVTMNIPWEAQHWHLNRLLTLIRVINDKNAPPKKMSRASLASRNRALNEQRRQQLGTKG